MARVVRSSAVFTALLVLLLASPALADSHAPADGGAPESADETAKDGSGTDKSGVAGGRDISAKRDPKLVWSEMVQILDKMEEVSDDRDMRALVLTPQEQALFVAFSKRIYDLSKELEALLKPTLTVPEGVRLYRAMQQFRTALGELRALAGSPIHRDVPRALEAVTRQMKGVWLGVPDPEKTLGPEGLPSIAELDERMRERRKKW